MFPKGIHILFMKLSQMCNKKLIQHTLFLFMLHSPKFFNLHKLNILPISQTNLNAANRPTVKQIIIQSCPTHCKVPKTNAKSIFFFAFWESLGKFRNFHQVILKNLPPLAGLRVLIIIDKIFNVKLYWYRLIFFKIRTKNTKTHMVNL